MGTDLGPDHLGHEPQHRIPGTVSDLVVDVLEVIQVDHQGRELAPWGPSLHRTPVADARQRVTPDIGAQLRGGHDRLPHRQQASHGSGHGPAQRVEHALDVGVVQSAGGLRGEPQIQDQRRRVAHLDPDGELRRGRQGRQGATPDAGATAEFEPGSVVLHVGAHRRDASDRCQGRQRPTFQGDGRQRGQKDVLQVGTDRLQAPGQVIAVAAAGADTVGCARVGVPQEAQGVVTAAVLRDESAFADVQDRPGRQDLDRQPGAVVRDRRQDLRRGDEHDLGSQGGLDQGQGADGSRVGVVSEHPPHVEVLTHPLERTEHARPGHCGTGIHQQGPLGADQEVADHRAQILGHHCEPPGAGVHGGDLDVDRTRVRTQQEGSAPHAIADHVVPFVPCFFAAPFRRYRPRKVAT